MHFIGGESGTVPFMGRNVQERMNSRILCRQLVSMENSVSLHCSLTLWDANVPLRKSRMQPTIGVAVHVFPGKKKKKASSGTEFLNFCLPRCPWGPRGVEKGSLLVSTEPGIGVESGWL